MDATRPKPDSRCTRCLTCFGCAGCRRRTLYHKLSPLIIQIAIVTAVWLVVKKLYANRPAFDEIEDSNISLRSIKSSDDQVATICNHEEYNKGLVLSLKDIISASGSSEKRFFLQVDVLTRDSEHDVPTLYSSGTTVIMDGFMTDNDDIDDNGDNEGDDKKVANVDGGGGNDVRGKKKGVDKKEFYYDNAVEEEDLGKFSASMTGTGAAADKETTDGNDDDYDEDDDNDTWGSEGNKDKEIIAKSGVGNIAGNGLGVQIQGIGNNGINGGQVSQNPQQPISNQLQGISPNSLNGNGVGQNAVSNNMEIQNGNTNSLQSVPQTQTDLNFIQPQQNNNMVNAPVPTINNLNGNPQQQNMIMNNNNNNNGMGQQQSQSGNTNNPPTVMTQQIADGKVSTSQPTDQSINNGEQSGYNQNLDIPGFKERLAAFKTEYYGRPVTDSSEQRKPSFAMNNPALCDSLESIDVLLVIHTIPQSNEQRQRIRATFAKRSLFEPFSVAHVFIVGLTTSPNFQANLDNEHEQYNDIVQGEFADKPESRTIKGLVGFRWVTTHCQKAKFVFKINEDVFVDTDKLLQGLIPAASSIADQKMVMCYVVQNAPIPRSGPNAFDHDVFPKSSRMRPHCKGFAVLTNVKTISSLITASEHVPVFKFDDLYLFGVLPFLAGEVDVYDLGNKRAFHDFGMAVVKCYTELQDKCPFVATKAFSARFTSLWEIVSARRSPDSPLNFNGDPSLWKLEEYRNKFEVV